jgi:hypothetical protein
MKKVSETENTVTIEMDKVQLEALMLMFRTTSPVDFQQHYKESLRPDEYKLLHRLDWSDRSLINFVGGICNGLRSVKGATSFASYRDVTPDDVGKTVEVRDAEHQPWTPRLLVGVLPERFKYRYIVESSSSNDSSINFRQARIKD